MTWTNCSLVTGGAGFIGSHLVEQLTAQKQRVRVFDDFSTGLKSNLDAFKPEIVTGDLADHAAVSRAMAGVNVVYHLGALASVARSVEDPTATHRACNTGTLNVLDAAPGRSSPGGVCREFERLWRQIGPERTDRGGARWSHFRRMPPRN